MYLTSNKEKEPEILKSLNKLKYLAATKARKPKRQIIFNVFMFFCKLES